MLSNTEIERYKATVDKYNKAVATESAMQDQLAQLKKQAKEILAKHGLKSMNGIQELQAKLSDMETLIQQGEKEMIEYIEAVNAKKEEKDRILLG